MRLRPTTTKRNDMLWELLPFRDSIFSTEQIDYQLYCLPDISNDASNMFRKGGMYIIHVNMNSLLSKIDEIRYVTKLISATVIGLSKTKLDNAVLCEKLEIERYELLRFGQC